MPVIGGGRAFVERRAGRCNGVGVVEADEPNAGRIVQRERVAESVRALPRELDPPDLEFQPVAAFQPENTPVESQQKFECMFRTLIHTIS